MNFEQTDEFKKELKSFSKKWRTLPSDLDKLSQVLPALYIQTNSMEPQHFRDGFFNNKKATVLQSISESTEVVKARLDSRSLGNKSILRLTYIRCGTRVLFIELYAKNQKSSVDKARIQKYLDNIDKSN